MGNYVIVGGSSGIGKELVKILESQENDVFATFNKNITESRKNVKYQKLNVFFHP